ncbi:hypothetical protein RRG08_011330 [Elysia crispata]|uniref:Uncharacterized protein n=1 Tax=Elysia crispata TaxID=231223 RepID=A0AAE1CX17_9GAST|nr:hypothetical protein RRG08_011330 [Elysia crispata]
MAWPGFEHSDPQRIGTVFVTGPGENSPNFRFLVFPLSPWRGVGSWCQFIVWLRAKTERQTWVVWGRLWVSDWDAFVALYSCGCGCVRRCGALVQWIRDK